MARFLILFYFCGKKPDFIVFLWMKIVSGRAIFYARATTYSTSVKMADHPHHKPLIACSIQQGSARSERPLLECSLVSLQAIQQAVGVDSAQYKAAARITMKLVQIVQDLLSDAYDSRYASQT